MKVAVIASECLPFSKTGGLADVVGSLPTALSSLSCKPVILTPYYRDVHLRTGGARPTDRKLRIPMHDGEVVGSVREHGLSSRVPVYFIEQPAFFDREGLYGDAKGDHKDNARRFIFFCRAALELLKQLGDPPDIIHVHDWHTALVPIYVRTLYQREFPDTKTVLTIHNLSYQGLFFAQDMNMTGLDWKHFNWLEMEFFGKLNFLKAGIVHADAVTTVSPTYAQEIQTEEYGCGLEGAIGEKAKEKRLHGILNGADYQVWNPLTDGRIPRTYTEDSLGGKAECKATLQSELGLDVNEGRPLMGVITRLVEQKGVDLILKAIRSLLKKDVQFVVLGSGVRKHERALLRLAKGHPKKLAVSITFDEDLAHRIEAGSDMFLMPSKFEPCGLNQIYSLRYGTLPVVRRTGGLADTVTDGKTGFVFDEYSGKSFLAALRRALKVFGNEAAWRTMVRQAMKQDFSWDASAKRYHQLFESLRSSTVHA